MIAKLADNFFASNLVRTLSCFWFYLFWWNL